ncbi:hypothetical protein [Streptomyces sp. NPDC048606]|uniref:hypothetical protein n=1 Tax=Streptomyces sp. NPDC048606 TaxID=3154726 RepID=UPI003425ECE0
MPEQTDPHEILRTSSFEGTLEEALAAHPPRAEVPLLTVFLAVGVLAVGGLVAGIHVDRTWGREYAEAGPGAPTGRFGQGQPPRQQVPGGARPNAGLVQGTITAVNGDSVTVQTSDGGTVTLKTGDELRTAPSSAPRAERGRGTSGPVIPR